ncbi:ABC transporter ATP-binding protein [Microbacterium sp. ZXX196]|uniref:ABC transporter ATP-binding protein n=1 Tax=Microbacterium sp. ZXX196 TaxID=2609291 RepID=UPI0012B9B386|nr:ABC transporter ATP-binding protein [Microbacterium sp. ZXX196]MTE24580.1 ATP-binding cassette domain-containing protein [Microbacterium sp. ZXX196]
MSTATLTTPDTTAAAEPLIEFAQVEKTYSNGFQAVTPFDLSVGRGEIVSLVGPSGCGKTTIIRMAAGLSKITGGTLTRRTDDLAYVFQDPTLLAWRNVRSNVELVAKLKGVDKATRRDLATRAIETVGLSAFEKALPRQLSGGMKMRVSLARAITGAPDLLMMDEPFAALDEFTRATMQAELLRLWRVNDFSAMFITHSISEAVTLGHRIVVMASKPGRIQAVIDSPSPPTKDGSPRDERALAELGAHVSTLLAGAH